MNLKNAIGLIAHKLLDWKVVVNPITSKFYPEQYSFKLYRFRKKNVQWFFITPNPLLLIDCRIRSQLPFPSLAEIAKYRLNSKYGMSAEGIMKEFPLMSSNFFILDFPSLYPHNELKMVDDWIFQLKLMMNYFTGMGNIETQNPELNQLAYQMRDKMKEYRKKRFNNV